jgi:transcriptional regulator with XRE-family HTH domain
MTVPDHQHGGAATIVADAPGAVTSNSDQDFDGGEIRALRKVRGLSLTALAEQVQLSIGYLSQIERNMAIPSVKALMAIARALDVALSDKPEPACEGCCSDAFRPPADATRPGRQRGSV